MVDETRLRRIADLLLKHRESRMDWGEICQLQGRPCSKKVANKFLLCCLLDYQMPADRAWDNGYRLVQSLYDPDDVWRAITSFPEIDWKSKHAEYKLHRFPAAHNRLWRIGKRICDEYDGDARRIWEGKEPGAVLEILWNLRAGDQISRMIVGALRDCGQVKGEASDVKGDIYIRRVVGRAVSGKSTDAETAVQLARQLHPPDPWQLDAPLWRVGRDWCKTKPMCSKCYLAPCCAYALAGPKESQAPGGSPRH